MTIHYNVTGSERKRLAQALGAILLWEPVYVGAPTFAYKVGNYTVDKSGAVSCPASASQEIVNQIIAKLKDDGFTPESVEGDAFTVSLPCDLFTPEALDRLREIIGGKAPLFSKAFQNEHISFEVEEDKLCFPWFHLHGLDGEAKAYSHFICALGKMARERRRITAKPYTGTNDKFTMRLFLVQLGLKGPKYKQTRKILLMNLSGNSAWKNGAPPMPLRTAVYMRVGNASQISKPEPEEASE